MPVEIDAFDHRARQDIEDDRNPDPVREAAQQQARRQFNRQKRRAILQGKKAGKRAGQQVAKRMASRGAVRGAAAGAGATVVGLIVTYLIWTVQAIGGNLMGSKWIPSLAWWELILWTFVSLLLFFLIVGIIAMLAPIMVIIGGTWGERIELMKIMSTELLGMLKNVL